MSDILDALLTADAITFGTFEQASEWGIFLDGEPVVVADQVKSFAFRQDFQVSTYPVEQGGFETYDKVQVPFEPRVQFVSGGDLANRQALLDSIAAIVGDLNLYDVVTPERVYLSCNVTHHDYERTSESGVGLIKVNVHLLEVRVTVSAQYNTATPLSNTKSPGAADPVSNGTVQPNVSSSAPNLGAAILPANFT